MTSKPSRSFIIIILIAVGISLLLEQPSYGLEANQSRPETAARRSQNAAKTIKVITGMSEDETIPVELLNRAHAVGVFPDVVRMNIFFSEGMKGYGVICSRRPEGWNLPAYYSFGSSTFSLKIAGGKSFDLILLFMNKKTVDWFQAGRLEFKGLKIGIAGPVGKLTRQADLDVSGVNIIIYALVDGKLKGMNVESDFRDAALLNPDNNINKEVYGMKGREVLQGKVSKLFPTTSGVTAFRDILNEKFRLLSEPPSSP
jgi:SH3 domain-containing YSC84-like protein 1